MKNTKNIVIISNPFGYGPTGKAIAIAKAFIVSGYKNIIFAGNSFTQEIIPNSISTVNIDERNQNEIISFLKKIKNPVVISSQNRFAIHAAKSLNIPCAFLDGLAWFWKDIPEDHFLADEIFWMNYPEINKKLPEHIKNIHIVPAIIDVDHINDNKKDQILIHIGGCKNSLTDFFPKYYIEILANSLYQCLDAKIVVTGGLEAIEFLKSLLKKYEKNRIICLSLKHGDFIRELSKSFHFISTAGQTATLEAFALGIPTSFLLPMNLSQLALTEVLDKYSAASQKVYWDSYFSKKIDLSLLDEKNAILKLNEYAKNIYNNQNLNKKLIFDLVNIINNIPDKNGQEKFIDHVGTTGANAIRDILIKKWCL